MAGETLLTLAEVLASLPDNATQLIAPLAHRNQTIALVNDVGFVEEDSPFTIPIVDGVFVGINILLPTPEFVGNFWISDGNNALIPEFGAVTINPGHTRLLDMVVHLEVTRDGAGLEEQFTFQFFQGGSPVGREVSAGLDDEAQFVNVNEEILYDYSVAAPMTIQVRGDGTGSDLDVSDFSMKVIGALI